MTSVRIVSPIIDTPSSTPDANGDDRRHRDDGRQDPAVVAPQQEERDAFEHARLRDDRHEQRQAEDEQHRVGVNQIVEAAETTAGAAATQNAQPRSRDLDVPRRRRQPAERRDDDEQHPVGQRVLVDLVAEGSEDEQSEDRREHFGGQQPERERRDAARRAGWRRRRRRSPPTNHRPGSMTTAGGRRWRRRSVTGLTSTSRLDVDAAFSS